ncbi:junctional adhesion molecule A isoform X1 [Zalophus californianus]|uniref:Junctional adhesion molecule A n=1 Tax=Zalophus californianus TaxID=9704 RepID=A0A6J2EK58_ZALCA|nr:junctional adhesion molecule A isoform X1 [Zalophus californianus]XP_027946793.1 junctional adhesion molecule A isoform X2 [Eumetopias jubatus]
MGTEMRTGRKLLLLFTSVILCSLAWGKGSVYTSEPEVRVAENKPAKLSCSYSSFSSPRVEWKFAQGDITSLVCYNNKITASYEDRVTFSHSGITFHSVTRKDTGMYTCMVSEEGGNTYGEVTVKLIVLVPPSKPTVNIPSSATIGSRAVLTCSEKDGSPPSEFYWFKDGVLMPTEPKSNRAFSNSSYSLNHKTGELVFDPVSASDTGEYTCQAQNGYGAPMKSDAVHMEAAELNVGGIVAAVLVTLILLGFLILGIWFAHRRGYFDRTKKGTSSKKVIYSQPTARSEVSALPRDEEGASSLCLQPT